MRNALGEPLRALGLVLLGLMLMGACMAASASALTWATKTGGTVTKFTSGQEETVAPSLESGTEAILEGKVGGTPIKLSAKKLSGESTKIKQEGTNAVESGKLVFSELKLSEPATCTPPTSITTTALKSEMVEASALTSGVAEKTLPQSGEVFASFKLGGTCAIAGTTIQIKTTNGLYGEVEPIGVGRVEQPVLLSPTINGKMGGNLFTGANAANLSGKKKKILTGALHGLLWILEH